MSAQTGRLRSLFPLFVWQCWHLNWPGTVFTVCREQGHRKVNGAIWDDRLTTRKLMNDISDWKVLHWDAEYGRILDWPPASVCVHGHLLVSELSLFHCGLWQLKKHIKVVEQIQWLPLLIWVRGSCEWNLPSDWTLRTKEFHSRICCSTNEKTAEHERPTNCALKNTNACMKKSTTAPLTCTFTLFYTDALWRSQAQRKYTGLRCDPEQFYTLLLLL